MALSLKLEVKSNSYILVTNLDTKEEIEVTLSFLQKATKSSLLMLVQYKYYELVLEADRHWNNLKKFEPGKEIEILKKIELEEEQAKNNIRNIVKTRLRKETAAKQQRWNDIAVYNNVHREWMNDGYSIILQSEQSFNRALSALEYADYCLENDCRYNATQRINENIVAKNNSLSSSSEEKLIALEKENHMLRMKIIELQLEHANSKSISL